MDCIERDGVRIAYATQGRGPAVRDASHRAAPGLAHDARGMLAQRDSHVIELLSTIDVPTLVLVGSRDEQFLRPTDYMASRIPGATKVIVDDAGHAANIDQPD